MTTTKVENPIVRMRARKTRDWGGNEICHVDWWLDHPWEEGRRETQHFVGTHPAKVFEWTGKQLNTYFDEVLLYTNSSLSSSYFPEKMPDWKEKTIQAIMAVGEELVWSGE